MEKGLLEPRCLSGEYTPTNRLPNLGIGPLPSAYAGTICPGRSTFRTLHGVQPCKYIRIGVAGLYYGVSIA